MLDLWMYVTLFTATLLTLINPLYVNRRKVITQVTIVSISVIIFIATALTIKSIWVYVAAGAAYMVQLTYYTVLYTVFYGWFATRFANYVARSNFYGHFKRITGETPIEYRRHLKN